MPPAVASRWPRTFVAGGCVRARSYPPAPCPPPARAVATATGGTAGGTTRRTPVVLMDVMDTVVADPFFTKVPAFFGVSLNELFSLKTPDAWLAFERGEIEEDELYLTYFKDGRQFDGAALKAMIAASYDWVPGMEELLANLKEAGVEVHACSNYPVWYTEVEAAMGLSRYLEWSFVSCNSGVRKPDPAAFVGPAAVLGLPPGDCLLVDDSRTNVEGAQAVGMDAVHFQGAGGLRQELRLRFDGLDL